MVDTANFSEKSRYIFVGDKWKPLSSWELVAVIHALPECKLSLFQVWKIFTKPANVCKNRDVDVEKLEQEAPYEVTLSPYGENTSDLLCKFEEAIADVRRFHQEVSQNNKTRATLANRSEDPTSIHRV